MAKQQVGALERHLEKAILGVAGLALLGAIGRFVITTPNQIELAGEVVTPRTIDAKVVDAAERLRQRARTAEAPEQEIEVLAPEFKRLTDPFEIHSLALTLPRSGTFGPPIPMLDQKLISATDRTLAEVLPMEKPLVTFGRSTLQFADGRAERVDWVTVTSEFNVRKQSDTLAIQYGPNRKSVVFGPTQIQRRARRVDGTWSDDDWQDVMPNPAANLPPIPTLSLTQEGDRKIVPEAARKSWDRFYTEIREPGFQLRQIRPLMLPVRDGDDWKVPVISSYRNIMLMDWQYLFPNERPKELLEDRYGEVEAPQGGQETQEITIEQRLKRAEENLAKARETCDKDLATRVFNDAVTVRMSPREATRADVARATQLRTLADRLLDDIERDICKAQAAAGGGEVDKAVVPVQQIWVHDATPGAIEPGETYQYRMRVTIANSLAGQADKFKDPSLATTVFIPGPWTEPSDPIQFEPDTYVFVTNSDKQRDFVTVEFFKWFEGVWVKTRSQFSVGDEMLERSREPVPSITDPGGIDEPTITFDASAKVVDIDHDRPHRERKRNGSSGVSFGSPAPNCTVVWVDGRGRLHERFVTTDKSHPSKSVVSSRVFKPPR